MSVLETSADLLSPRDLVQKVVRQSAARLRHLGFLRCPALEEISAPGMLEHELNAFGVGESSTLRLFPWGMPRCFFARSLAVFEVEEAVTNTELHSLQKSSFGHRVGFAHLVYFFEQMRKGAHQFRRFRFDDTYPNIFLILDHKKVTRAFEATMVRSGARWEVEWASPDDRPNEVRIPGSRVVL